MQTRLFSVFLALIFSITAILNADIFYDYDFDEVVDEVTISYLKLSGAVLSLGESPTVMPLIGVGKRLESHKVAVDYSMTCGFIKETEKCQKMAFYYSAPRILCFSYTFPDDDNSFYYGAGAGFGGVFSNISKKTFHGISLDLALGYEFQRNEEKIRSFIQLNVAEPVLAAYKRGKLPGPTFELSLSLGF